MPTITPCLWFDGDAEPAAQLYTSLFPNSRITDVSRYGEGAPFPSGTALTVDFELDGKPMQALNGGPQFPFTEAVSLSVSTKTQEETDHYWDGLIADGGEPSQCGWLKDRFGLSWQIVPSALGRLIADPDQAAAHRTMQAMLSMSRLVIAELQAAHDNA